MGRFKIELGSRSGFSLLSGPKITADVLNVHGIVALGMATLIFFLTNFVFPDFWQKFQKGLAVAGLVAMAWQVVSYMIRTGDFRIRRTPGLTLSQWVDIFSDVWSFTLLFMWLIGRFLSVFVFIVALFWQLLAWPSGSVYDDNYDPSDVGVSILVNSTLWALAIPATCVGILLVVFARNPPSRR